MIAVDRTVELFADQAGILRRLVADALATHPVVGVDLLRRSLDMVDGVADAENFLHDGGILTALCDQALAFHAAGEHAAALAWGKAAYVANRRFAHAWLDFLDIALGAQAIAKTGLEMPNPFPSFLERLKRSQNIPPSIVQYWDTDPPPDDVAAVIAGWARFAPKYTHRLIHDADARAFLATHGRDSGLAAYDAAPNVASRADIFRLAWIAHHGGIYADADEWPLDDIDLLLPANTGLVLNWSAGSPPCVNNWFIAARPRHPLVMAQLRLAVSHTLDAPRADPRRPAWVLTGPGVVSMVLLDHVCFLPMGRRLADVVLQPESEFRRIVVCDNDLAYKRDPKLNWRLSGFAGSAPLDRVIPDISLPYRDFLELAEVEDTSLTCNKLSDEIIAPPTAPDFAFGPADAEVERLYFEQRKCAAVGLFRIPRGCVFGSGLVTYHGKLIRCVELGLHEQSIPALLKECDVSSLSLRRESGALAVIAGPAHEIYGHWLIDHLPKLWVLEQSGINIDDDNIRFLMPNSLQPFAREWLTKLGIAEDRLVYYDARSELIQADELLLPTAMRFESVASPLLRRASNMLIDRLIKHAGLSSDIDARLPTRIFIPRSNSHYARLLTNRHEITEQAAAAGLIIVRPERLPIIEQVAVFRGAKQIVGEYGSALHGSLFAKDNTVVAALRAAHPDPGFLQSGIGRVLGQPTGYVFGQMSSDDPRQSYTIANSDFADCLSLLGADSPWSRQ